jgi:hypothetical protein
MFSFWHHLASFRARGKAAGGSTEVVLHVHLRRAVDPDLGVARVAGRAGAILGQSAVVAGEVSESNSADGSTPRPSKCIPVVLVA